MKNVVSTRKSISHDADALQICNFQTLSEPLALRGKIWMGDTVT